jgi:hypothetical protein
MATCLSGIQKGVETLSNGSSSVVTTITSVDLTKSFLLFNYTKLGAASPGKDLIRAQLTSSTQITFNRVSTVEDVTIYWQVLTFSSGVTVQRGTTSYGHATNTDFNVTITAVDASKSIAISSFSCIGDNTDDQDFPQTYLSSATNVNIHTNSADASSRAVDWQVIEFNNAAVQTGTFSMTSSEATKAATITTAAANKSFVIASYLFEDSFTYRPNRTDIRSRFTSTTQVTFDRNVSGYIITGRFAVVTFNDQTMVQGGTVSFASGDTTKDVTLGTAVANTSNSSILGGYFGHVQSSYVADDSPAPSLLTTELTSTTNLRFTRFSSGYTTDGSYFVIEFPVAATGKVGTTSLGTVAVVISNTVALTGNAGTSTLGSGSSEISSCSPVPTGIGPTGSVGTVTISATQNPTVSVTGNAGTSGLGTPVVIAIQNPTVSVTGNAGTMSRGTPDVVTNTLVNLTSNLATSSLGTTSVTAIQNPTFSINGNEAVPDLGSPVVIAIQNVTISQAGFSGSTTLASSAVHVSCTVSVTGFTGTSAIGSQTVIAVINSSFSATGFGLASDLGNENVFLPIYTVMSGKQSGVASLSNGSTSVTVTISSVTTSKSVLFFSYNKVGNSTPTDDLIQGRLASATTIIFERYGTVGDVNIAWYVVSFSQGVNVQRGVTSFVGTTAATATITAVDLTKTILTQSSRSSGGGTLWADFPMVHLSNSTTVVVTTISADSSESHQCSWQAVEFLGSTVQSGSYSLSGSETSKAVTVTAVDVQKSILFNSYNTGPVHYGATDSAIIGYINSPTQLKFERYTATSTNVISGKWFLASFFDGTFVQQKIIEVDSPDYFAYGECVAVDFTRTIALGGSRGRHSSSHTGSDNAAFAESAVQTSSLDGIKLEKLRSWRGAVGYAARVAAYAVTFPTSTSSPNDSYSIPGNGMVMGLGSISTTITNAPVQLVNLVGFGVTASLGSINIALVTGRTVVATGVVGNTVLGSIGAFQGMNVNIVGFGTTLHQGSVSINNIFDIRIIPSGFQINSDIGDEIVKFSSKVIVSTNVGTLILGTGALGRVVIIDATVSLSGFRIVSRTTPVSLALHTVSRDFTDEFTTEFGTASVDSASVGVAGFQPNVSLGSVIATGTLGNTVIIDGLQTAGLLGNVSVTNISAIRVLTGSLEATMALGVITHKASTSVTVTGVTGTLELGDFVASDSLNSNATITGFNVTASLGIITEIHETRVIVIGTYINSYVGDAKQEFGIVVVANGNYIIGRTALGTVLGYNDARVPIDIPFLGLDRIKMRS